MPFDSNPVPLSSIIVIQKHTSYRSGLLLSFTATLVELPVAFKNLAIFYEEDKGMKKYANVIIVANQKRAQALTRSSCVFRIYTFLSRELARAKGRARGRRKLSHSTEAPSAPLRRVKSKRRTSKVDD